MLPASTQRAVPVVVTTLRCGGGPQPGQPHTSPAPASRSSDEAVPYFQR